MTETILEIKKLKTSYGKNEVLKDISLSVKKGEVISIIGSSGSGKSTFLRSINLLESPSGGEILYHGTTSLKKVTTSLPIVKDSVWFSNPSTSLKTLMSWKMLS